MLPILPFLDYVHDFHQSPCIYLSGLGYKACMYNDRPSTLICRLRDPLLHLLVRQPKDLAQHPNLPKRPLLPQQRRRRLVAVLGGPHRSTDAAVHAYKPRKSRTMHTSVQALRGEECEPWGMDNLDGLEPLREVPKGSLKYCGLGGGYPRERFLMSSHS